MKHRKISFNRKNLFKKGWLVSLADYTYLIILAVIAAFPLIWIILSSLKSKGELIGNPTAFWPQQFTLDYNDHLRQHLRNNAVLLDSGAFSHPRLSAAPY